ncbi:Peptidase family S41 [Zunongwangia mangrovi]|uniref:Peptidase family S41 n=1 Tax=Zunongwangia mangrovi TaxID=1334022 RepID=A0A1I1MYG0_9FLAO|nr:S41 family peptidase [Zunongwangia mangrovi]SFC88278.1 Peptidase family S41 [Zunongwangia mangrovi]
MFRRYYSLIFFIFLSVQFVAAQECDCTHALSALIKKVENEYPGFKEKTKDALIYNNQKNALYQRAKIITKNCLPVLEDYVNFFNDSHIWLIENKKARDVNDELKSTIINIDQFLSQSESTDPLEGIWTSDNYKIGIKKKGRVYEGFVLESESDEWPKGALKLKIKDSVIEYAFNDHVFREDTYSLHDNSILHLDKFRINFIRQSVIAQNPDKDSLQLKLNKIDGLYFEKLSSKTAYIRLSNFSYRFVEHIEAIIENNKKQLEKSHNLIIDLRGNGGGTDDAYQKLLPYIATNPLRHIGVEYLVTPTLIEGLENYLDKLEDTKENRDDIIRLTKQIKLFKEHPGEFVNPKSYSVEVTSVDRANNSPEQIVFLVDEEVGSAAENLLLLSRQSKKVKIMGRPSYGVLDYASARIFNFGCTDFQLVLPTYRSLRLPEYPIDNIGVQPDIYLDKTISNWVKFAIDYLEF